MANFSPVNSMSTGVNMLDSGTQSQGFAVQQVADNKNESAKRAMAALQQQIDAEATMKKAELEAQLAREGMQMEQQMQGQQMEMQAQQAEMDRGLQREQMGQQSMMQDKELGLERQKMSLQERSLANQERQLDFEMRMQEQDRKVEAQIRNEELQMEQARLKAAAETARQYMSGVRPLAEERNRVMKEYAGAKGRQNAAITAFQAAQRGGVSAISRLKEKMVPELKRQVEQLGVLQDQIRNTLSKNLVKDVIGGGLGFGINMQHVVLDGQELTQALMKTGAIPAEAMDEVLAWNKALSKKIALASSKEGGADPAVDEEVKTSVKRLQTAMTPLQFEALVGALDGFIEEQSENKKPNSKQAKVLDQWQSALMFSKAYSDPSLGNKAFVEEFEKALDRILGIEGPEQASKVDDAAIRKLKQNAASMGLSEDDIDAALGGVTRMRQAGRGVEFATGEVDAYDSEIEAADDRMMQEMIFKKEEEEAAGTDAQAEAIEQILRNRGAR